MPRYEESRDETQKSEQRRLDSITGYAKRCENPRCRVQAQK
jgi:hypothetical protein